MIDYSMLIKSLKHLEAQYNNFLTISFRTDLGTLEKEAIKESVIQRFETCYDTLWKTLKRYLNEELGIPEIPNSPKPIFRIAAENKLLQSNVEQWLQYADARIYTSHNYSEEKAEEAVLLMNFFIPDAINLLKKMTGSTWE
jgi:nucleotidyltransferase substrate binding protein (TIGR01987 family)